MRQIIGIGLVKREQFVLFTAWALSCALIVQNLIHHGLWLDETHAWCLVRDSSSFADLRWNMRNEGHPWLWHAMLWPLAKSGAPVWSMQVLNGMIAIAVCTLILFRAPFPVVVRTLLVFGYFLAFEYAALSRNYGIGILLLVVFADRLRHQKVNAAFIAMLLLPQVHLWAACLVGGWAIVDLIQPTVFTRWRNGLLLLSVGVALACVLPADTLPYSPDVSRLAQVENYRANAIQLTKAFVPIPEMGAAHPWNTSRLVTGENALAIWTGPLLLLALLFLLPLAPAGRIHFIVGCLGVLALPLLAPFLSQRYVGPVLMIGMVCAWAFPGTKRPRTSSPFVLVLLFVQAIGGLCMSHLSWHRPFSLSKAAAGSLGETNVPVMIMRYDAAPSISAYLGRPVYLVFRGREGSFCVWNEPHSVATTDDLVLALQRTNDDEVQVVSEAALETKPIQAAGFTVIASRSFMGSMLRREDHVVSRLERTSDLRSPR